VSDVAVANIESLQLQDETCLTPADDDVTSGQRHEIPRSLSCDQ